MVTVIVNGVFSGSANKVKFTRGFAGQEIVSITSGTVQVGNIPKNSQGKIHLNHEGFLHLEGWRGVPYSGFAAKAILIS